jgi:hypothetical protein
MTEANIMPPEIHSSILKGQKALIVGVANDRSIAWGCAQAMQRAGAEIAMTYLSEKARPYVEPLASAVEASLLLPLEVRDAAQVDALFEAITSNWGHLDILIHSIAFAPRQALEGRVTDCPRGWFPDRDGRVLLVVLGPDAPRGEADDWRRDDLRDELSWRQRGHRELRHHGPGEGGSRIGSALPGGRARTRGAFGYMPSARSIGYSRCLRYSPISMR